MLERKPKQAKVTGGVDGKKKISTAFPDVTPPRDTGGEDFHPMQSPPLDGIILLAQPKPYDKLT